MLIPALLQMLSEVEEDLDTWAEQVEEKEGAVGTTNPHHVAINAINCISTDLGEKTILIPLPASFRSVCRAHLGKRDRLAICAWDSSLKLARKACPRVWVRP